MKIAYITSSLEGGGSQFLIPAVTRVLRNAGAEVQVFALSKRDGRALPAMLADGLQVHVREGGDRDHLAAYIWLDKQLKSYQPSLIWTSVTRASVIGLPLGLRHATPVVCWQHNAELRLTRLIPLWLLRRCPAMWIGDSDFVTAITAKRFDVPPERLACWPLFTAKPDTPQARAWCPGQTLRLGSLGRLHSQKGYDVLIDALARLKRRGFIAPVPFKIAIAGDGRDREKILSALRQADIGEQVDLVGFADRPLDFLAGLHLYLQPSRIEGFGIAMHEAAQAGLPIIATSVGQMGSTIEPGHSGWLVPPGDADALADALAEALSNPQRLAAMGQVARARVLPRYSADVFRMAGECILERLRVGDLRPTPPTLAQSH